MSRCVWRVLAFLCTVGFAVAQRDTRSHPNASWSLGNGLVERDIAFDQENGLETERLRYLPSGRDFVHSDHRNESLAGEFSFRVGDRELNGRSSFVLRGAEWLNKDGAKVLRVDLSAKEGHVDVSAFYAVYPDQPAIRKWITVTNRTTESVRLSHLCFETLDAGPGAVADLTVSAGYGSTPRELFFTGRVSDPAIFLRNSRTGEGVAILNEAPGYLKRTEVGSSWSEKFAVMYDTDLFPFARTLAPGETFESAKSSLVFFSDERGLADSRWVLPRYASEILSRRHGQGQPPWIYNSWEPFFRKIDAGTVREVAAVAQQIGLDIFTIDDGWQAEYGSNDFDHERFPGGFSGVHATLGPKKLKLGLWVPLAAISTDTQEYRSHPEWVCRNQDQSPKSTQTAAGTRAVMCLASGYRDLALRRLINLIEQYHPAYIKVDLTTVFNAYGEQPGCYAPNHLHRGWAESLTRIYEALEYIGEQLYQAHPEVLVDYTFELWGEKHLIDPGLLRCADLDWLSNVNDETPGMAGPLNARMLLYSRAISIPSEAMLIGNLRASTLSIEERFVTAIGAGPLFLGDLRKLSPQEREWYSEKIRWYKSIRSRANLSDSFIPLGSWRAPNAASWDGFARLSRTSDGIIAVFKNESGLESVDIRLPAIPNVNYAARSVISGRDLGTVRAEDLTRGWTLKFSPDHAVEAIELTREGERQR